MEKTKVKTKVKTKNQNINIFHIMGFVSKELKKRSKKKEADEMCNKVFACASYHEALKVISNYAEMI